MQLQVLIFPTIMQSLESPWSKASSAAVAFPGAAVPAVPGFREHRPIQRGQVVGAAKPVGTQEAPAGRGQCQRVLPPQRREAGAPLRELFLPPPALGCPGAHP